MDKHLQVDVEKDLLLSHFTLANLHEGVFWVDSSANIFQVNDMACEMTGYSREELVHMKVHSLNPSDMVADFGAFWKRLRQEKKITFEALHIHKKGHGYPVEITGNFIEYNGMEFTCSIVRDIRKRKLEEDLLRTVSEATSSLTGKDFLMELARHITLTLTMRYAVITECTNEEKTRLRTLCYLDGEKIQDNIEYDTEGLPCEIIMQGKDFFMERGVEKHFPKEKGIEAAVGVPIFSSVSGDIIGHILALDPHPAMTQVNQAAILKIFAARAGAEIERLKAEKELEKAYQELNDDLRLQLKKSEEQYRDLFEQAPIAYVHEGMDTKFISANKAALRILGVDPGEVNETYGSSMVPDTPEAQRRLKEAFESVGRGTDTSGVVLELRRKDNGKPIWIQWWSNPVPGGQYTRTMFVDITDMVLMEREKTRLQAENKYLQEEIKLNNNFDEIISGSKSFQKILWQVEQVAGTDSTVLILGESGTGKELLARAIHNLSKRSRRPLVKVNCAALPANLIESELFGHEKGAFTGATDKKIGRFELADSGTIFLDEIGELPVDLQSKLLRVLQEGEFERLGNSKTIKVDVRVIAATNRKLDEAIDKKEFREDLYYRLNVFPILTPPLRDRKEDIPLLVQHFCRKYEAKIGRKINHIPQDTIDRLMSYHWPGNIRELENIIERALILTPGDELLIGDWLPRESTHQPPDRPGSGQQVGTLEDMEKAHILSALELTGWKVSGDKGAARILGLNATTLEARMKKLGIHRKK